ncbi:L-aspartate oxidase [Microbacterium sp. SYP-A9085]|uniref:L-aspartate oxidase n=1 Tax=Microbacterium sp. SYP-A9085 TaxID=2664454 RepID=UPI0013238DE5|nr:L-aspartate oxidase [Microbacterium sp. SYP-A9085]
MTHVVVVGSGIAGITAALHAARRCDVTLVTKGALDEANTAYAQGGVAAVTSADDTIAAHIEDTITAGSGANDPAAVRVLVEEGPARIAELVDAGVTFDRDATGAPIRGREAAHSHARVLHAGGDATGRAIQDALVARLRASSVRIVEHAFLVDLVVRDHGVAGVDVLVDGRRTVLPADAVILATGGAGQLYAHTTNPAVATADGIAAALRAGVRVADLEFVQFHPTVLATASPFLVSEAVRGEGAVVRDAGGRRFLFDAHPDGELAPRDVVARAIARRSAAQGAPVVLDATGLYDADPAVRAARLRGRFPTIDGAVRARGFDWAREPVPVTPAAHYLMGGVVTDLDGRTSLAGLYAVGECARTGVHGANRLASNSLLEGAVFGARAGDAVAAHTASAAWPAPAPAPMAPRVAHARVTAPAPFSRAALQELMWRDAGLLRDAAGLAHAAGALTQWAAVPRIPRTVAEHEDENLLTVARAVVAAASARTSSLGAHHRLDDTVPHTVSIPDRVLTEVF